MDMPRSQIQVRSIDAFTCQHFQQLFKDGNKSGIVTTTNNGRRYDVMWEAATNTISVKRDMTNMGSWDRVSETLSRWSAFGFTSHAEKWQRRLMLQKHNVEITQPLIPNVDELLTQIDELDTNIAPSQHRSNRIQSDFNKLCVPLRQLVEEKKQDLANQAQHIFSAVTTELPANKLWARQKETQDAIEHLQEQVRQLRKMMVNSKNTLALYSLALGSINVSKSSTVYDAFLTRYIAVMSKVALFIQNYFDPTVNLSNAEVDSYNSLIHNDRAITEAFISEQMATHFTYNELLLPPVYQEPLGKEAQKQDQVRFNYQPHIMTLTNVLIDPTKTIDDIHSAAKELAANRSRWQEQIKLEEKIGNLLHRLHDEKEIKISHPIFLVRLKQLEELQKNIHNHAEILRPEELGLLQSQYKNIERANTLHIEIGQFIDNLSGFITLWKMSNYNDEMQSRILHLSVLRTMCEEEVSLTNQALNYMEHFATLHKNVLQQWSNGDAFSRLKFYEPISSQLSYPAWLVEEHRLFKQKAQEVNNTLWETKYQLLRNAELLKARERRLEKTVEKTEVMVGSSEELKDKAHRLPDAVD